MKVTKSPMYTATGTLLILHVYKGVGFEALGVENFGLKDTALVKESSSRSIKR